MSPSPSYDSSTTKVGNYRYQFRLNGVAHPQMKNDVLGALHELAMCADKVHQESTGNMVTSIGQWHAGAFIVPLCLNHPGEGVSVISGFDSRGIQSSITLEVSGQTMPTASAASGTTNQISTTVLAEMTSTLFIGLGKSLAVRQ